MLTKQSRSKIQGKSYFNPVDSKVDFPKMEREILDEWGKNATVSKYLAKNNSSKKTFSFLDGPITANNPMGIHHAWGRTYKDLWQRFKNMQGFRQRFQNGFDSQGLWVEVEVEKELGFKSKKDIEKYGVSKFVQKCKDRVVRYAKVQTQQSERLGYFMDWDNSYFTMSDENNFMIWHFLKVCHENGWLYKGKDSVPWCPRCETAISQHEILAEDYKELIHESIYFKLPVVGKNKEYLLVWTTTPWTLPANVAVAVDKNLEYSLVQGRDGNKYWLAKDAVKKLFGKNYKKIVKTMKGERLVGKKYPWAFDNLERVEKARKENEKLFHSVVATDERILSISTEEGTGMVHIATGAGTEDFALGKKMGLPILEVIKDDASYLKGLGEFSGKNAKANPEIILGYLKKLDETTSDSWVFEIEKYKHRYPACWRCKEELVWKVTDEWYIAMDRPSHVATDGKQNKTLRKRMIGVAKKIEWIPEFGLKRELDWLNNMHDWLISKKNRYWGLALPIWECGKCHHFEVIGSKKELEEKTAKGWDKFSGKSPHKPQIDEIKIKCTKCGKLASRIEPVGNPWLDAGIVAYSTIAQNNKGTPLYLADKKLWKEWFPADFITESFPGQFKNWFYSLIAMSTVLENEIPAKTILGFATLLAEDGEPMHKSTGNMIEFNKAADEIGVDVMRWMYLKQNYADNLLFGYKKADEVRRSFHLMLWNIYRFFVTYANLDEWNPEGVVRDKKINVRKSIDLWAFARLYETLRNVTNNLNDFDAKNATHEIEKFVSDLSLWYIRRSRNRVGVGSDDKLDKDNFYFTLSSILHYLCKIIAPFTPFIADEIFKNISPNAKKENLSVHLTSWPSEKAMKLLWKDHESLIKDMALVRKIVELGHSSRKLINIPVRQPLSRLIVRCDMEKLDGELLQLIKDELNVKEVSWKTKKSQDKIDIELDSKITEELKEEGKTRELIRKIQNERKKQDFKLRQKAIITSDWLPGDDGLLENIRRVTLASTINKGKFKVKKAS